MVLNIAKYTIISLILVNFVAIFLGGQSASKNSQVLFRVVGLGGRHILKKSCVLSNSGTVMLKVIFWHWKTLILGVLLSMNLGLFSDEIGIN